MGVKGHDPNALHVHSGSCPAPSCSRLALLFAVSFALLFLGMAPALNLYDEGLILVGAERVLNGEVPYRDFWTMYGPGQFYLTAALFKLFGVTDLALRVIDLAAKAATTVLAFVIVARFASRELALAAAAAVLLLLIGTQIHGFPVFPALALALGAMLALERGIDEGSRFYLVAAGALTGLATAFRHDMGAYSAFACGLVLLVSGYATSRGRPGMLLKTWIYEIGAYALGVAVVVLPITVLLLGAVNVAELYQSLITIPANVYPPTRALPFPGFPAAVETTPPFRRSLVDFAVYAPFAVVAVAAWLEWRRVSVVRTGAEAWREHMSDGGVLMALLILTTLLFTLKGLVRVSAVHMVQSLVLAIVLLAALLARTGLGATSRCASLALAASAALLVLPLINGAKALARNGVALTASSDNLAARCFDPVLPRLRCVALDADALAAARYVAETAREADLIYAGAGRHDKLFVNGIALYFAAERRSVTKWHELHPGVQTTAETQSAMVAEMQAKPPRLVILDERWDKIDEPNASRLSSGVTLLDDHIRANFSEVERFGPIRILAPKAK